MGSGFAARLGHGLPGRRNLRGCRPNKLAVSIPKRDPGRSHGADIFTLRTKKSFVSEGRRIAGIAVAFYPSWCFGPRRD